MRAAALLSCETKRGNAMNRSSRWVFILLSSVLLTGNVYGQEKFSFSSSTAPQSSRYVKEYSIDLDDVPGHKIRIVEIQRSYTKDNPEIMGVKVVESWLRGSTDYIGGIGPAVGYDTWVLEDGNRIFLEWSSLSSSEPTQSGSRRGTSHATSRFVGGTDKFAGIQGTLMSTVEFDTDKEKGYSRPTMRGEYWIKK